MFSRYNKFYFTVHNSELLIQNLDKKKKVTRINLREAYVIKYENSNKKFMVITTDEKFRLKAAT